MPEMMHALISVVGCTTETKDSSMSYMSHKYNTLALVQELSYSVSDISL